MLKSCNTYMSAFQPSQDGDGLHETASEYLQCRSDGGTLGPTELIAADPKGGSDSGSQRLVDGGGNDVARLSLMRQKPSLGS